MNFESAFCRWQIYEWKNKKALALRLLVLCYFNKVCVLRRIHINSKILILVTV